MVMSMMLVLPYAIRSFTRDILKRYVPRALYSTEIEANATEVQEHNREIEIIIPHRVPRGPTDILKALASTLKKDYTAAHYKYEDDPYFIPAGNVSKRAFALSKESGMRAARYFLEKYPDYFKYNKSVPNIKAFDPPPVYTEADELNEDILKSCITSADVKNAVTVYELLKQKDVSLDQEIKQMLLELLCFYNCKEPPFEDYYEERWFARKEDKPKDEWSSNGLAEILFEDMEKDAAAYCTMIQGLAKYHNVNKAVALYEELCEHNFPATLETYNSMLSLVTHIKEDGDMRWDYAMNLINAMNADGLSPDIYTMNALMNIIERSRRWSQGRQIAMKLLAEMKRLGIEPSLGTYSDILTIFCQNVRGYSSVLAQVINKLHGMELTIRHPNDTNFFAKAMEICNKDIVDKDLAYQIYSLLETGNNCELMGNALSESIFFQKFFKLLCMTEDFEKFMELYEKLVPNTYTPEPSVMQHIIDALSFSQGYQYLPKICSDVILFEQTERDNVLNDLMKAIGCKKHEDKDQAILVNMVWSIIEKIDRRAQNENRRSIEWTGFLIGNMWKTFLYGNDLEKSWIIMQRLKEMEVSIIGYPSEDCFIQFCQVFLRAKEFFKVEYCLKFASEACYPDIRTSVSKIAFKMLEENELEEFHRPVLSTLAGGQTDQIKDVGELNKAVEP